MGVGGDPVTGESFTNILEKFENDPETEQIVMLGEIGGIAEVKAAKYAQENLTKPIIPFIRGALHLLEKEWGMQELLLKELMVLLKIKRNYLKVMEFMWLIYLQI